MAATFVAVRSTGSLTRGEAGCCCFWSKAKRTRRVGGAVETLKSASVLIVGGGKGVAACTKNAVEALGGNVVTTSLELYHPTASASAPREAEKDQVAAAGVDGIDAAVFAVGSGAAESELRRWQMAVACFQTLPERALGIFVARSIVIPELVQLLHARDRNDNNNNHKSRWVVLRPGALVAEEEGEQENEELYERQPRSDEYESRLLLTDDVMVNGVISRELVAHAVAKIAFRLIDSNDSNASLMLNKVIGVYDSIRIISRPRNVRTFS